MKRVISTCLTLCLSAALALPASALDYSIDAPGNPDYGDPTSIEVVHTADGGAMKNEDVSKNAALIPPSFGSPSADALGTGTYLTPNLAPGGMAVGTISGGNMPIVFPPTSGDNTGNTSSGSSGGSSTSGGYTYVTDDLYYDQLLDQRLQNTGKVSGVFEIDFDRDTFSAANAMDGWHTYRIHDVSVAAYGVKMRQLLDTTVPRVGALFSCSIRLGWRRP